MKILLDIDEVLVDFIGPACELWNSTREAAEAHWLAGVWDMIPPLSKALGLTESMPPEVFWTAFRNHSSFWPTLPLLPWFHELLAAVSLIDPEYHLISAPTLCHSSYTGKVLWIKKLFGEKFDRFALTPHKELFARPDIVLIDDRDSNVEKFRAKGGFAIVFPRYHNSQHRFRKDPMPYVLEWLRQVQEDCAKSMWQLTTEAAEKR
jgi:5' nucleotidase, deoxy (Pyrimidine), cytosolic type C protein (NT5C)